MIELLLLLEEIVKNGTVVNHKKNIENVTFIYSTNAKFERYYKMQGLLEIGNYTYWSYEKGKGFYTSNIVTMYEYQDYILLETLNSKYLFVKQIDEDYIELLLLKLYAYTEIEEFDIDEEINNLDDIYIEIVKSSYDYIHKLIDIELESDDDFKKKVIEILNKIKDKQ